MSDEFKIPPVASPEILHPTVWRTFHSLQRWKMIVLPMNSHYLTYTFLFNGWENVLFEVVEGGCCNVRYTISRWINKTKLQSELSGAHVPPPSGRKLTTIDLYFTSRRLFDYVPSLFFIILMPSWLKSVWSLSFFCILYAKRVCSSLANCWTFSWVLPIE